MTEWANGNRNEYNLGPAGSLSLFCCNLAIHFFPQNFQTFFLNNNKLVFNFNISETFQG